jgi:DNA-binding response OmpR family regulator
MLSDVGHVVVVDDDPSLRQMVIRYLEDHNMPVKSASNRIELNRHFAGTSPSLIILDLRSEAVTDLTAGSLNRVAVDSWIPIRRRSR